MKRFALILSLCLLPTIAVAQCRGVVVPEGSSVGSGFEPSSPNIRVVTFLDSKVAAGAKVDVLAISANSRALRETMVTDDKGVAVLPTLSPGNYVLHMWTITQGWFADSEMPVYVPSDGKTDPITYMMTLTPDTTISKALEALGGGSAASALPGKPLKEFTGVVQDAAPEPLGGIDIVVWRIAGQNQIAAAETKSGTDGKFHVALADGAYFAMFKLAGFQSRVLVFQITARDSSEYDSAPLIVSLTVGQCL
jgi:hypothetical protein